MDKVICPICQTQDRKSIVMSKGSSVTLVASVQQWDEDGNPIPPPKVNTATHAFVCSNGHRFIKQEKVY